MKYQISKKQKSSIKSPNPFEEVNLIKKKLPFKNNNIPNIQEINTSIKLPLPNNNDLLISKTQEDIKESSDEMNLQSTNEVNTSIELPSMKSPDKMII